MKTYFLYLTLCISVFIQVNSFNCNAGCTTCTQDSTATDFYCVDCNNGFAKLSDKTYNCIDNTNPYQGYWYDQQNTIFQKCNIACSTCTDDTIDTCDTCNTAGGYYKIPPNSCYPRTAAPAGYFFNMQDLNNLQFSQCYSTCSVCDSLGDSNNHKCNECKTNKLWKFPNTNNCIDPSVNPLPVGYFFDNTNGWKKCFEGCNECTGSGTAADNQCNTCANGYLVINTSCYKSTSPPPDGYYLDNTPAFSQCHTNCKHCSGSGTDTNQNCTECANNLKLYTDHNCYDVNTPPADHVWDTQLNAYVVSDSSTCYESCAACLDVGDDVNNNCATCKANYYPLKSDSKQCARDSTAGMYLDSILKQMIPCDNSCNTCSNQTACLTCKVGFYRQQGEPLCKDTCPSGYYKDTTSLTCKSCVYPCVECDSSSKCTTCPQNFVFIPATSKCEKPCQFTQFLDTTGNCVDCPRSCKSCKNQFTCLTCPDGYIKYETNCVQQCPKTTYIASTTNGLACLPCNSACASCQDNSTKCLECKPSFYRSGQGLNPCVLSCPKDLIPDENSICRKCQDYGKYIYQNSCVAQCPDGYVPSLGICKTCKDAKLLFLGNSCVNYCPKGYTFGSSKVCYADNVKFKPAPLILKEAYPITECTLQPCLNSGICKSQTWNNVQSLYCECTDGFWGRRCENSYQKTSNYFLN
jgi:proprotein convertase subtilisin/kexin type 5